MTRELALEQGLGSIPRASTRSWSSSGRGRGPAGAPARRSAAIAGAGDRPGQDAAPTDFTGYEALEQRTTVGVVEADGASMILKLAESPFYATGGGQVADAGRSSARTATAARRSSTSCAWATTRRSSSSRSRAS